MTENMTNRFYAAAPTQGIAGRWQYFRDHRKGSAGDHAERLRQIHAITRGDVVKPAKPTTEKPRRPSRASPTQAQVRNVVKAAMNAGLAVSRVEIVKGKITVFAGEAATTSEEPGDDLDRELADFEARHGQV